MKENLVSYKTALLAKEKAFDWVCNHIYTKDEENNIIIENLYYYEGDGSGWTCNSGIENGECFSYRFSYPISSAPSQSFLQKWIRDTHKIHITVTSISQESWQYHITKVGEKLENNVKQDYNSYEEALEYALIEILKPLNTGW